MRTSEEMFELIISVAEQDERIKAAVLGGSRADAEAPQDIYQDYDVVYYVDDAAPFWNNIAWIEEKFGRPAVMEMPETMELPQLPPDGGGQFIYLMLFEDHNRIDLTIDPHPFADNGEPAVALLDKCGFLPEMRPDPGCWHVKRPTEKHFRDCCSEFWWCLNNVGKGIARDERPYAMRMFNSVVRDMLDLMTGWYIGVETDFSVSPGKMGKYFKRHLPPDVYAAYLDTYSDSEPKNLWRAVFEACGLFRRLALEVAQALGFRYDMREDENMLTYLRWARSQG